MIFLKIIFPKQQKIFPVITTATAVTLISPVTENYRMIDELKRHKDSSCWSVNTEIIEANGEDETVYRTKWQSEFS